MNTTDLVMGVTVESQQGPRKHDDAPDIYGHHCGPSIPRIPLDGPNLKPYPFPIYIAEEVRSFRTPR